MRPRRRLTDRLDALWSAVYGIGVVLACIFLLAPLVIVFIISLSAAPSIAFPPPSYTLSQYMNISPEIVAAFGRSLRLALSVVVVDLVLCVPAAFALARANLPVRWLFEIFARSPLQLPGIVLAVGFYLYYSYLQRNYGILLRNNFSGLLIAHVVLTAPYVLTTVTGRLYSLGSNLEAASLGLGAGFIRTMWHVVLPQIRPALLAGGFLAFVVSFEDVPVALFLAPGAAENTLPVKLFMLAIDSLSPALFAAVILVLLFSVVLVLLMEVLVGLRRLISGS